MKSTTIALLASMFIAPTEVQLRFPEIPDSAEQYGIGKHPDPTSRTHECLSTWCCSYKDCRPLAEGSVRTTDKGWSVPLPDGRRQIVEYTDKLRIRQPSPECAGQEFGQSYWACFQEFNGEWTVRCFYPRAGLF